MKKILLAGILAIAFSACGSGDEKSGDATANYDKANAHLNELLAVYKTIDTTALNLDTVYKPLPAQYTSGKNFILFNAEYKFLEFLSDTSKRKQYESYGSFDSYGAHLRLTDNFYLDYAFWSNQNEDIWADAVVTRLKRQEADGASLIAVIVPVDVENPKPGTEDFSGGWIDCNVGIYDYKTKELYCSFPVYAENGNSVSIPENSDAKAATKYLTTDIRSKLNQEITKELKARFGEKVNVTLTL